MKIAVFPGSFDPITKGHVDIVERAIPLFDEVVVAIGVNTQKKNLYSLEKRMEMLTAVFGHRNGVRIDHFHGLTVHYCQKIGAEYLLRGIRSSADFEYEKTISQLNKVVGENVDTVFYISRPEYSFISSTIVREIIKGKGNIDDFVPQEIIQLLKNKNS